PLRPERRERGRAFLQAASVLDTERVGEIALDVEQPHHASPLRIQNRDHDLRPLDSRCGGPAPCQNRDLIGGDIVDPDPAVGARFSYCRGDAPGLSEAIAADGEDLAYASQDCERFWHGRSSGSRPRPRSSSPGSPRSSHSSEPTRASPESAPDARYSGALPG